MDSSALMELLARINPEQLAIVTQKIDLPRLIHAAAQLDDASLSQLSKLLQGKQGKKPAPVPESSDFYQLDSSLSSHQHELQLRVRAFMEQQVEPIIADYWSRDTFPRQLISAFRDLDIMRHLWNPDGSRPADAAVLEGILTMEMARIDVSSTVFFGVHAGLVASSIALGGSPEQRLEWLPKLLDFSCIGAFGLTEPEIGSAAAGGLTTTCQRQGDGWVLNGQKKWIGNATFSDIVIIWARDVDSQEVRGFIVRTDNTGYQVEKMMGKIALRAVENGLITLHNCHIAESDRLQNVHGFRTTADVLRMTRAGVAWQGVGCALGAYQKALAYCEQRQQFGKPIASFQLVQHKLVQMLGHVIASQSLCLRLSHLQDAGHLHDEQASLAKLYTAKACRETVALGRELLGGNGILLEHHLARYFCDAEAIYSYEGTHEINSLVVGRAITGISAFV